MANKTQTLRFRRPGPEKPSTPKVSHHTGILQDQVRRHERRPWAPSFSLAVRLLLLVRVTGAMYSNISDCDEVFNFWEPLHYLDRGHGFQTWETSPAFSIRSWAYVLLHLLPVRLSRFIGPEKRPAFFIVRIFLSLVSTVCEATLYRAVLEKINLRVGRYLFFMLLFNAGMWSASSAFLPSSFAMYANTIAFSYAMQPPSNSNYRRTVFATLAFATGAIVGWPFALAIAIPYVFESLFLAGDDVVPEGARASWLVARWKQVFGAGAVAALLFIPVIAIDTLFYGRLTITAWNIISYNIFADASRGPELYGTAPWHFYIANLLLNFNVLLPLALLSLPALLLTRRIDRKRVGGAPATAEAVKARTDPYVTLALRLAPAYVWLGILSAQPHKEERFMFPAYTMLCFNAAVTLYLVRGWMEVAYIKATSSSYQASRTSLFRLTTSSVLLFTALLSFSRVAALWHYYHAPLSVVYHLEATELPRLLNVTGLLPAPPPPYNSSETGRRRGRQEVPDTRVDLGPVAQFGLTVCVGKEWHRFPGSYLVPDGVRVAFVKSEFDGLVPGRFAEVRLPGKDALLDRTLGTRLVPAAQNDLNRAERSHYVDISTCDYLLDLDFPLHPVESALEPRYAVDSARWERVVCLPFLDARHSALLTRALWAPGAAWRGMNEYGDWCLLRSAGLEGVGGKVSVVREKVKAEKAQKEAEAKAKAEAPKA